MNITIGLLYVLYGTLGSFGLALMIDTGPWQQPVGTLLVAFVISSVLIEHRRYLDKQLEEFWEMRRERGW